MSSLEFAIGRLNAFLAEVQRLDECEFPYEHSQVALHRIRDLFDNKLALLQSFDSKSDPAIVKQQCTLSLSALFDYVPLLGFILRSTNVRNAFEVFGPLLRLARDLLEPGVDKSKCQTRLVLSSEWDYSPFVYGEIPDLPGFVLIGLPAPESSNPLLIPLAGHELGHAVWQKADYHTAITPCIKTHMLDVIRSRWKEFQAALPSPKGAPVALADLTTNMFCVQFWQQCVPWALRQAEESYCDFVGIRIFGESYLHAFAYILSPSTEGERSLVYPNMRKRVSNLLDAASSYGVPVPPHYLDMFDDLANPNLIQSNAFLLSVADSVLDKMKADLIDRAVADVNASSLKLPSQSESDRIFCRFLYVVPAENCKSLADILNAGWRAHFQSDLWDGIPHVRRHRERNLKELVLKNFEVYEIEQILKG
ncbi:MAG TPA: hypothetical protein VMV69_04845 [Pirellulales bacterium]|nr:hypothetical protein [Pirellulales bacterium]